MLLKLHTALESGKTVTIEKTMNGKDVGMLGAFPCGSMLTIRALVPRALGICDVVLRIARDGEEAHDLPFRFCDTKAAEDTYTLSLDTAALCAPKTCGLFYYEYRFLRGADTLVSDTVDQVEFRLSEHSATKFHLLIHPSDYTVPDWFGGGTMYHIFLDRFYRGEGRVESHKDARLESDWNNGVPQYASRPGEPLKNNVFFGGNLWGVIEKLDYLSALGVTVLYLSPIFQAYSNHRYDTGDYETVDALLGGDEAFDRLIEKAHARGMRVILDGVFNHTGDDSKYFNRRGTYPEAGAYQSQSSPYYPWYTFYRFPDSYECWWNIEILPRLNHRNEACRRYFTGRDGIVRNWLLRGADGWRLDVADELSDPFLEELRQTVKTSTDGNGIIIGEVWENAAEKIAYGKRREYFLGKQLDSVMNYPFRTAVLSLIKDRDAQRFCHTLIELYASYPLAVSNSLMNVLGTHDTARILTELGEAGNDWEELSNDALACRRLSSEQRSLALQRLKLASALQFTVFGVPSVYYGDEAGMEGYRDPFCRRPFPWGKEDRDLIDHYRALGRLRQNNRVLKDGRFRFLEREDRYFVYERASETERLLVYANVGEARRVRLPADAENALTGTALEQEVRLASDGFLIVKTRT